MHGTVEVPRPPGRFLAAVAGLRRAGDSGQRGLHGPGKLGHRPAGRRASSNTALLWVVALASLMAIFLQVISARLGRGDRQGPGPVLPRWYPAVDALAELAALRDGHRRVRSGRGAGQRGGAQPPVSTSRCSGRSSSRRWTCCCCWRLQRFGMRTIEAVDPAAGRDHRRLLLHRDFRPAADRSPTFSRWAGASLAIRRTFRSTDMVYVAIGDHRRDGDAAQPVPALRAGAEPQVPEGRSVDAHGRSASTRSTRPSR